MRISLIGSTGQLGQDLVKSLHGHEVTPLTHQEIEVSDLNSVQMLKSLKPDVIIDTAAFHKTDLCEDEPEKTFAVNSIGPKNIVEVSKQLDATLIFISTDYVFSGTKGSPYTEEDSPNPINTYGISKLAGELFIQQKTKHYIFRVSSLFGKAGASGKGGNFVETMTTKAKKNEPITVVDDMWMTPTYTHDAAEAINQAINKKIPYGTYHLSNQTECTWYQFSQEIFRLMNLAPSLKGMKTSEMQVKAKRPLNSSLASAKLSEQGITMRSWKEALRAYLVEKGYLHT